MGEQVLARLEEKRDLTAMWVGLAVCLLEDLRWAGSVRTLVHPARPAVRPRGGGAFTYTYYLCPWTPTNPRDVARCPGHARSRVRVRGDHITTAINRHTFP
jgi:hypothetical protein